MLVVLTQLGDAEVAPPGNRPWQYVAHVAALGLVRVNVLAVPCAATPVKVTSAGRPFMCTGSVTTFPRVAPWQASQEGTFIHVEAMCTAWAPTETCVVADEPCVSTGGEERPPGVP
jgi:hypothetical protein